MQDAANGINVDATRTDTDSNDIATGLTDCVTRDGQSPWLANLPAGGFKITGLASGSAASDSVTYGQVFSAPAFTSPSAVASPAVGDNSLLLATTAWVTGVAFSAALPAQATHAGQFVTTNGTIASWSASLLDGTMRFANTSDTTKLLAFDVSSVTTGTTRTVTIPNSSGTMAYASDIKFKLLATLTPTAAANIDFLSTFTSSYDNYLIIGSGIKVGTDDALSLRLAVAGTSDTGSNYSASMQAGGATSGSTTTTATSVPITSTILAAGKGANFIIEINNANDATNIKRIYSRGMSQSTATPTWSTITADYAYFAANAVSGIRLFLLGGNNFAAAGNVRVYGYNNI